MFGVFSRYIARRLFTSYFSVFLAISLVIAIGNLMELMRRGSKPGAEGTFFTYVSMSLTQTAMVVGRALPFVMMLAALWAFIQLSRRSEFIAVRASGASFWRGFAPAAMSAFAIGMMMVAIFNPLAAMSHKRFEYMEAKYLGGRTSLLSFSDSGLWLRDGQDSGQSVIQAARANSDGTVLFEVTIHQFGKADEKMARIDAKTARLGAGEWQLSNVYIRWHNKEDRLPLEAERFQEMTIATTLTREEIQDSFATPESISVWRMASFIERLQASGFSARRHLTHWYSVLVWPLLFPAITLIAAALTIRPPRFARYGLAAFICAIIGFGIYFMGDITLALSASGAISPVFAVMVPLAATGFTGVALAMGYADG